MQELQADKVKSVYVVLGTVDYLADQLKQQFLKLIPTEEQTMNVGSYDMETTPVAVALDDAMSAPFFGERRLVFINHPYFLTGDNQKNKIDHDLEALQRYFEQPEPATILVLMAPYEKLDARKKLVKTLKKQAAMIEVNQVTERETQEYVQAALQKQQLSIEPAAFQELMSRTDGQLGLIMTQLPKLMIYAAQSRRIDLAAVDALVTKSLTQNVFDLVNDVLRYQTQAAVELYHELVTAQEAPLKINAILLGQFRLLLQVKILERAGYSQGSLASTLKVHPYRVKLAMQTVRQFNQAALRAAYLGLLQTEVQMKTTQRDPELLFELFMVQFVNDRRAAKVR
ncbi:DNA polymerase III subunit delta [Lactiplantibacillus mudanjiangensis]|uniref:DNA polymerase III subunit delta n=1 Tax=Lactiplantibacillus mudanjiangensis TaxID=1296538 RepID=A0A660E1W0_9LACO|nr:DNA polymerase III subunit delta [Lactiplantibacillus mudanjiangensis]VDG23886.1 DNA polymerase III subunit delta [Lactobacillus sp.] [Lactiplantibacillus mudanjiangensis]VDG30115.1 DNA polymerase III subunit delta [Lactobacillus sp.] [Lactiplantibacillus mudanjiangensis]VDG30600.1 DNA polymerase III subunit delta [Lactobacillus sp.] [Lactiplantibacillus mudanjiangensis]